MAAVWIAVDKKEHHALLPSNSCLHIFIKTNRTGEKSLIMNSNSNNARPVKTNINNIKKNKHYSRNSKGREHQEKQESQASSSVKHQKEL